MQYAIYFFKTKLRVVQSDNKVFYITKKSKNLYGNDNCIVQQYTTKLMIIQGMPFKYWRQTEKFFFYNIEMFTSVIKY